MLPNSWKIASHAFRLALPLMAIALCPLSGAFAQSLPPRNESRPLKVGVKAFQPFVFLPDTVKRRSAEPLSVSSRLALLQTEAQQPYGYSIDLWNAIARETNVQTEFVPYASVQELLAAVKGGDVDIGIAGISITADRLETGLNFSYPFFQSGLQLMVKKDQNFGLGRFLTFLQNWASIRAVLLVIGSSAVVGSLVWALEHKHNEGFPARPLEGIGQGFWFAIVTLGTFGYGDVTPVKLPARIITSVWMGISFFIVADFISSMAVQGIEGNVKTFYDLRGEKIGVVEGTTGANFVRSQPVIPQVYKTFDDAVTALGSGKIAGIVRDYPEIQYFVARNPEFETVGDRLTREDYGIAVTPDNYALLKEINYALLILQERGVLRSLDEKWFGPKAIGTEP